MIMPFAIVTTGQGLREAVELGLLAALILRDQPTADPQSASRLDELLGRIERRLAELRPGLRLVVQL